MIEQDTICLLRECDAGVHMGTASIDEVLPHAQNKALFALLQHCKQAHETLGREIAAALHRFHDKGKDPNPMAKSMSWVKTNFKLAMKESDATIADLMVEGCSMGTKSLSRYLNQYQAADEASKALAKKLIDLEGQLAIDLRPFL